jgi:hypothetical protein
VYERGRRRGRWREMIIYREYLREYTQQLLHLIQEVNKVAEFKVIVQNLTGILHVYHNKVLEKLTVERL